MNRDVRTKVYFADKEKGPWNPKQLYLQSDWKPPSEGSQAELEVNARLAYFGRQITSTFKPRRAVSNLLPLQRALLRDLKNSTSHIVMPTDKNLGPAVIERDVYTKRVFDDHLNDKNTYERLTENQADMYFKLLKEQLSKFLQEQDLSKADFKFLQRSFEVKDPWSYFYLTAKVHKSPLKTRPIVSVCGSITHGLGRWLDQQLQPIVRQLPSFIPSSFALKQELDELEIPGHARMFTMDAVSMYTNIDTKHALTVLAEFLRNDPTCRDCNATAIIAGLEIVMRHNYFKFDDTLWEQTTGTAMGCPPACCYAELYYGVHEKSLMERFRKQIPFYKRYIDDGFGLWLVSDDDNDDAEWEAFQQYTKFGKLTWEFSERTRNTSYLDLSLRIKGNKIVCSLYEKPMNLHLYLPPHSAHSPGVVKGFIHGMIYRIYRLTTVQDECKVQVQKLFERLCLRGHEAKKLRPMFQQSLARIRTGLRAKTDFRAKTHCVQNNDVDNRDLIFFHLKFNPSDPPSRAIQQIFRDCLLEPTTRGIKETPLPDITKDVPDSPLGSVQIGIRRMIVAYHKQKSLRNILFPRRFKAIPTARASSFAPYDLAFDTNRVRRRRPLQYRLRAQPANPDEPAVQPAVLAAAGSPPITRNERLD